MIKLIVGNKGSGKTKTLINMANKAVENSSGYVICVEKGLVLTYDVDHRARLVNTEDYNIEGFDALYGFLTGLMAGNYDTTDIFVDATFKIGGKDIAKLTQMIFKLDALANKNNVNFTFTVSCDAADLPAELKDYIA